MHWLLLLLTCFNLAFHPPQQLIEFRLTVPTIGIEASVTRFYLDGESWTIGPWEENVGHLEGTGWLRGNTVLGGHSTYPDGQPGIFANLNKVKVGDKLILSVGNFKRYYTVTEIRTVADTDLTVIYPTSENRLTLITCDEASFNPETGTYSERQVVIAVEG